MHGQICSGATYPIADRKVANPFANPDHNSREAIANCKPCALMGVYQSFRALEALFSDQVKGLQNLIWVFQGSFPKRSFRGLETTEFCANRDAGLL